MHTLWTVLQLLGAASGLTIAVVLVRGADLAKRRELGLAPIVHKPADDDTKPQGGGQR